MTEINVRILPDDNPENPRNWDNLGIMTCFHKRYTLGDTHDLTSSMFNSWEEVEDHLLRKEGAVVILPLFFYDHSIQSISTRSFLGRAHHADWDSGQVGFIYITRKRIKECLGKNRLTKKVREYVEQILNAEVEELDKWIRGEIYGFTIEVDGVIEESCWGFYDEKDAITEAAGLVNSILLANLEVDYAYSS